MTPATTKASLTGERYTAKGSGPGRRPASRPFSSHITVWPGFSGISEMSGYMASGSRPAALRSDSQPCRTERDTAATGVRAAPAERKAQVVDVFGQQVFEGEGHRTRELDAAAGGQFRLRQQCLSGRR